MTFDTIIRGGTVATASDTFACDVGIANGRIAALGADLGAAAEVIDAQRVILINTELPADMSDALRPTESWTDVPPASVNYGAARDSLTSHVESLINQLERSNH